MKASLSVLFLTVLVGCAAGSPPSAFERSIYNIQTQVVEIVTWRTNAVIHGTNATIYVNPVTNHAEVYDRIPKESVVTGIQTGGQIATTFGFGLGGIIASLVLGAYGAFATWQNNRKKKSMEVLTNNVEVGHETILATAGAAVAAQFIEAIKSAQVKAGVKREIAAVVDSRVDKKEAKFEAESVVSLAKVTPVAL